MRIKDRIRIPITHVLTNETMNFPMAVHLTVWMHYHIRIIKFPISRFLNKSSTNNELILISYLF